MTLTVSDGELDDADDATVSVVDTIPPVTTPSLDGVEGNTGWWRSDVAVTLEVEERCGVDATFFELDGGGVRTYDGPFDVDGDGEHVVRFRTTDIGDNVESWHELPVWIDETPPDVRLLRPEPHCAYVMDAEVVLCAAANPYIVVVGDLSVRTMAGDATSGLEGVDFLVDGEVRDSTTESPHTFKWDGSDDAAGEHHIEVCAEDHAGNRACDGMDVMLVPLPDVGPVELSIEGPEAPPVTRAPTKPL